MKQKIIMKVQINCEKYRTKAMKIAAVSEGVTSVAIEGAGKSQVVVIGDGVDSASLTCSLRKKLGYATIGSVQKLEGSSAEKKPEKGEDNPTPILCLTMLQYCNPSPHSKILDYNRVQGPSRSAM
ncbi:hypothetical protein ACJW31_06G008700 [Castanea mollissima]